MTKIRAYFLVMVALSMTGCSIKQVVNPIEYIPSEEVCIIEDKAVREGFLVQLQRSLRDRGIPYRLVDQSSALNVCPFTITYTARWSWDFTIYMSIAELKVYRDGVLSGDAIYDSRRGGARPDKWKDAETKIDELVGELFQR